MIDDRNTTSLTDEGQRLIKEWLSTQQHVRQVKSSLNSAECEAANAINALGKWVTPADAAEGERIVVPYGKTFIEVIVIRFGEYQVKERARRTT